MIEQDTIEHHIQRHIVGVLMYQKYGRFRDLRPPKVDTNLFSYHLKLLQKNDWVKKADQGYTLSAKGLRYVDRVSMEKLTTRTQPKIISMLVIQNSEGEVLLQRRTKQPYIDTWTLPYGKVHIDDPNILSAAEREAFEKLQVKELGLRHAGDCYIRVVTDEQVESVTLAHVFAAESETIVADGQILEWAKPHKLAMYTLAPAVEQVVARTFFKDEYFFEEFEVLA